MIADHSVIANKNEVADPSVGTDDGVVMALSHRSPPVFCVQFHPESVLTPDGEKLLANFLGLRRGR